MNIVKTKEKTADTRLHLVYMQLSVRKRDKKRGNTKIKKKNWQTENNKAKFLLFSAYSTHTLNPTLFTKRNATWLLLSLM